MTISFNDTLFGTTGNDSLYGDIGNDSLFGDIDTLVGLGNDTLNGGPGDDSLFGGYGNDIYIVDANGDIVSESASTLNGGNDTVESSISYTLTSFVETLVLTGDDSINGAGNGGANLIVGTTGNNALGGGGGNDTLNGGDGSDTLNGGIGDDSMVGGFGNDFYVVDSAGDVVSENFDSGTDRVTSSISYTLGVNFEKLNLATGLGNLSIAGYGNELDNVINGNGYGNWLSGLDGNDTLYGGDDVAGGVNQDTLVGGNGDDNLSGSIFGTALMYGGEGNDTMDTGSDFNTGTMLGGAGNDLYFINSGALVIEDADEGTDIVYSDGNYRLGANVENLQIQLGTGIGNKLGNGIFSGHDGSVRLSGLVGNDTLWGGGDFGDVLLGGAGNDSLDGYGGADTMIGGAGNDLYVVDCKGDEVIERSGQGTDTVYASMSYSLDANLENLVLTGSARFGNGNDGANSITGNNSNNLIAGGGGNDGLVGGYGSDAIDGGDGNDTIDGGFGDDVMIGGAGDDAYFVDSLDDMTLEDASEGTDSVVSTVNWTLDDDTEVLQLAGDGAISGYGNALANTIYGNGQANTLNGKGGADTMAGGNGDDIYIVNAAGDLVTEAANGGTDLVISSVSATLAANVENLILSSAVASNATGNALANLIVGNGGANQLTGGNGHDTLVGGDGADSFRYAGTLANAHSDTINDFTHGTDHIDLDDALFTAIGAVGNLAAGAFRSGNYTATTGAVDASDRILYNTTTGDVYYDSNGSGAGGRTLIFTLSESPDNLSASDVRVI